MIFDNNKRSKIRMKDLLSINKAQKRSQLVDNFDQLLLEKSYYNLFFFYF